MRLKKDAGWSIKVPATDRFLDERQLRERWDNFRRNGDETVGRAR
jgi:hypothetical protein